MQIQDVYKNAEMKLHSMHGDREYSALEAYILVSFVAKKDKSFLLTYPEFELSSDEVSRIDDLVSERLTGVPIAYITGEREFWSLNLKVNSDTLIPRPDTETLVEQALLKVEQLGLKATNKLHILDLGTGSGAIALALKSELPQSYVDAVDYSKGALEVARENSKNLNLDVNFIESDWFKSLKSQHQYQIIVSNPPYIADSDPHLNQGDVRFEPRTALVAPMNGLIDILNIITESKNFLAKGGYLLIEHGYMQGSEVRQLFANAGFTDIKTCKDLGNNDRVTYGCFQKD